MAHHGGRREKIVMERTAARRAVKASIEPTLRPTLIDLGSAPFTVPCPVCGAPACSLCRRLSPDAHRPTLLVRPHPERWEEWTESPEKRVVPVR